jgi:hypothetical protein
MQSSVPCVHVFARVFAHCFSHVDERNDLVCVAREKSVAIVMGEIESLLFAICREFHSFIE